MSSLPKPSFIPAVRIERMMESELAAAGLLPPETGDPVIDIEAFLERHLGVRLEQFADLDADVLGVTHFVPGATPLVQINKDLTEAADSAGEPWVKGRWRITMAHEGAHVILHGPEIQALSQQRSLFDDGEEPNPPQLQRCLKRDLHQLGRRTDPREIQANLAMAALLMPRRLFTYHAGRVLPVSGAIEPESPSYRHAVADLAGLFGVSREATRIRIEKLGLGASIGQGQIILE
jgi:hypothetical protein